MTDLLEDVTGWIFMALVIADLIYLLVYRKSWLFVAAAIILFFSVQVYCAAHKTQSLMDIGLGFIAAVILGPVLLVTILWSTYHSICDLVSAAKTGQMLMSANFFRFSPVVLLLLYAVSVTAFALIDNS
jgi:hypothetical protein